MKQHLEIAWLRERQNVNSESIYSQHSRSQIIKHRVKKGHICWMNEKACTLRVLRMRDHQLLLYLYPYNFFFVWKLFILNFHAYDFLVFKLE